MYYGKATWNEAESICNTKGGHLWSIGSHEEWINVYEALDPWSHTNDIELLNTGTSFIGLKNMVNIYTITTCSFR